MTDQDKQELAELKRNRLCECGSYKRRSECCCGKCFLDLPSQVKERCVFSYKAVSPEHFNAVQDEIRAFIRENILPKFRSDKQIEGETERDYVFRLRRMTQAGIRISPEAFHAMKSRGENYRAKKVANEVARTREVLSRGPNVVGGMSKV